jgi:serine/threonine-protein kinase
LLQDAPGSRLAPERAVLLLEQICGALQAAHAHKIIHRDLKPENVFVVQREGQPERVKLLDFGIAKLEQAEGRLTSEGMAMGTPEYMSPEQARGSEVDGRADIYAVGCIAFEMFTGETPFRAPNAADVMARQVRESARSPRELNPALPEPLAAAVLRCLAKSPRGRFQSALDVAQAFSAALGMTFDTTGAFASWLSWDNPSGPVHIVDPPRMTAPSWFARLFARIREAF